MYDSMDLIDTYWVIHLGLCYIVKFLRISRLRKIFHRGEAPFLLSKFWYTLLGTFETQIVLIIRKDLLNSHARYSGSLGILARAVGSWEKCQLWKVWVWGPWPVGFPGFNFSSLSPNWHFLQFFSCYWEFEFPNSWGPTTDTPSGAYSAIVGTRRIFSIYFL